MKKDLVRIYFNRKEDFPKIWSVDFGSKTQEVCCTKVFVENIYGWSNQNLNAEWPEPKAWIEFKHVLVNFHNDGSVSISKTEIQ